MTGFTINTSSANSLLSLVAEWRDARQAIFDAPSLVSCESKVRWDRLAQAEHRLMDFARKIGPEGLSIASTAHPEPS